MNHNKGNWYSDTKFTVYELIAIRNVLKHSQDFGQGVAPDDIVEAIITKIDRGNKK